jgi:hypothetical protein
MSIQIVNGVSAISTQEPKFHVNTFLNDDYYDLQERANDLHDLWQSYVGGLYVSFGNTQSAVFEAESIKYIGSNQSRVCDRLFRKRNNHVYIKNKNTGTRKKVPLLSVQGLGLMPSRMKRAADTRVAGRYHAPLTPDNYEDIEITLNRLAQVARWQLNNEWSEGTLTLNEWSGKKYADKSYKYNLAKLPSQYPGTASDYLRDFQNFQNVAEIHCCHRAMINALLHGRDVFHSEALKMALIWVEWQRAREGLDYIVEVNGLSGVDAKKKKDTIKSGYVGAVNAEVKRIELELGKWQISQGYVHLQLP